MKNFKIHWLVVVWCFLAVASLIMVPIAFRNKPAQEKETPKPVPSGVVDLRMDSESASYQRGFKDGVSFIVSHARQSNIWLGPITITNDNFILSNCVIITILRAPPAFTIVGTTNTVVVDNYFRNFTE